MITKALSHSLQRLRKRKKVLLSVKDLHVFFSLKKKMLHAVRGVSFEVLEGEAIGIVGESGCGKSAMVQAITKLSPAQKIEGEILFQGKNLLKLSPREMLSIRGKKIGNVFQDPMSSLNPTMKIGKQIEEGLLYHKMATSSEAREKALEILEFVGVPSPLLRAKQYPHELSGGMRQRVLIAISLIMRPELLIADEPTTALDVTVQAQILQLFKEMQKHFQMSLILITHDLAVVSEICQKIFVVYAGKIVEKGKTSEVLKNPKHPYTQMLLKSIPESCGHKAKPLQVIGGSPPDLLFPQEGCAFKERCPFKMDICENEPPFFGSAACFLQKGSYDTP